MARLFTQNNDYTRKSGFEGRFTSLSRCCLGTSVALNTEDKVYKPTCVLAGDEGVDEKVEAQLLHLLPHRVPVPLRRLGHLDHQLHLWGHGRARTEYEIEGGLYGLMPQRMVDRVEMLTW